jgi:hypothetical protein
MVVYQTPTKVEQSLLHLVSNFAQKVASTTGLAALFLLLLLFLMSIDLATFGSSVLLKKKNKN